MIIMRQIHGSALWTEIKYYELHHYFVVKDECSDITPVDAIRKMQRGERIETSMANYCIIADATELDKKIQSKCTEIILSLMDNNKWSEIEAKEHLVGLLDSKLTYFKYPTI